MYELCPDSPAAKANSALASVPEDAAAARASSPADADVVQPEALQLSPLRTPRKAALTDPALPDQPVPSGQPPGLKAMSEGLAAA